MHSHKKPMVSHPGLTRNGVMTAFSSFEECKKAFPEVLGLLYNRDPLSPGFDFLNKRSSSFDFDNLDDPTAASAPNQGPNSMLP